MTLTVILICIKISGRSCSDASYSNDCNYKTVVIFVAHWFVVLITVTTGPSRIQPAGLIINQLLKLHFWVSWNYTGKFFWKYRKDVFLKIQMTDQMRYFQYSCLYIAVYEGIWECCKVDKGKNVSSSDFHAMNLNHVHMYIKWKSA